MQDLIFSDLNTFSKSTAESVYSSLKLLFELTHAYTLRFASSHSQVYHCCLFLKDLRWYAGCSFLFCVSSVSVYFCQCSTKSSPLITARNGNLLLTKRMLFKPTDK